jgi:signal transduction protein with GAF and PtsI domain
MGAEDKIDLDIFKVVNRAIAESSSLVVMVNHLSQLLVGALELKGCAIYVLNPESKELEALASFGLSVKYMTKGPLLANKSIGAILKKKAVIIGDVNNSNRLQYPEEAKKEGIGAIISIPIMLHTEAIGALRLYHHEAWDISEQDIDSLMVLGENIGLAMTYTRVLNALSSVKDAINDVHSIWLSPDRK